MILDEKICETLQLIEGMAEAGLPMEGYKNFAVPKGTSFDVEVCAKKYLEIIKRNKCCGEGNRPHYMKVKIPGGTQEIVRRRFFDGLNGSQYFANRFYGILAINCSAFEDYIEPDALLCLREYLDANKGNLRFILFDVAPKSMDQILKWEGFDIENPVSKGKDSGKANYYSQQLGERFSTDMIQALDRIIRLFPEKSRNSVQDYLLTLDDKTVASLTENERAKEYSFKQRMGFI